MVQFCKQLVAMYFYHLLSPARRRLFHQQIAQKLEIKFYFCKPYHSWERGANENTNGLIRQYIPKGKDFSEVTNKQIKWIENKLNNRPRKRLGYLTPNEKFKQIINQNSVAFAS